MYHQHEFLVCPKLVYTPKWPENWDDEPLDHEFQETMNRVPDIVQTYTYYYIL